MILIYLNHAHIAVIKAGREYREFNLMFKTQLGAAAGASSVAYLRPETVNLYLLILKIYYQVIGLKFRLV